MVVSMIQSFADSETERLYRTGNSRRWRSIESIAIRKLDMLNSSISLTDLRVPPGNRLEALRRDRKGQHSIRINDQFRICFTWKEDGAHDVEIVDYH
jgi:proteic killer suppression protein